MFCCELKFVVDICKKWTQKKFSSRLELSLGSKNSFKQQNPLNPDDKYVICLFELAVSKQYDVKSNKMSYCDFAVKKEHHFLQNIFTKEEFLPKKCPKAFTVWKRTTNIFNTFFTSLLTYVLRTVKLIPRTCLETKTF